VLPTAHLHVGGAAPGLAALAVVVPLALVEYLAARWSIRRQSSSALRTASM
jgi:hypothetical protein